MPIEVSCPCGMRSRGPDSLAGKQAKCPQCGNVLNLPPLQQPAPVLLTPLEPRAPAVPRPQAQAPVRPNPQAGSNPPVRPNPQVRPNGVQPARTPAPLTSPVAPLPSLGGLPAYDPLARPLQKPASQDEGGIPMGVWIGLSCGVGGAVVAGLIAIVIVSMSSRPPVVPPDQLAAVNVAPPVSPPAVIPAIVPAPTPPISSVPPAQGPTTSAYPMTSPAASVPADLAPTPSPAGATVAATSAADRRSTSSPMTPPELAAALASTSPSVSSVDSSAAATGGGTSQAPLALLGTGTDRWRNAPQSNLRGMQRFPDKLHTYGYSWMVELLPYLGEEKTYARFDFTKSWAEGSNLLMTSQVIPAFINPADNRTRSQGYPFKGMGLTHFVGMSGVEDARNVVAGELPRTDPRAGVFGYDEVARPAAITDGQSQTIMIIGSGNLAAPWVQGGGATVRGARAPYFDSITGFGSKGLSSAGTQVMMADGSVRAISASVDPQVFKAMCTIHGAESIDLQSVPFIPTETK